MASFEATRPTQWCLSPQTGNSSPIAECGTEGKESSSFLLDIGTQESGKNTRKTLAENLLPKRRRSAIDDCGWRVRTKFQIVVSLSGGVRL